MDSVPGRSDKSRVQLTYSSRSLKVAPVSVTPSRKLAMRISAAITVLMVLASLTVLAQGQAAGRGRRNEAGREGRPPTPRPSSLKCRIPWSAARASAAGLGQPDRVSGAPEGRQHAGTQLSAGEIQGQHQLLGSRDARRSRAQRGPRSRVVAEKLTRGTKTPRAAAPRRCRRWSANGCSISG